jgi:hypothetical protein
MHFTRAGIGKTCLDVGGQQRADQALGTVHSSNSIQRKLSDSQIIVIAR